MLSPVSAHEPKGRLDTDALSPQHSLHPVCQGDCCLRYTTTCNHASFMYNYTLKIFGIILSDNNYYSITHNL